MTEIPPKQILDLEGFTPQPSIPDIRPTYYFIMLRLRERNRQMETEL
jgi:hypothetical protein